MKIQYISGPDIDKTKWNSCVHYANNGNVFGYMWYLDHVAKDWDALVEGDYESVFPLVYRNGLLIGKELYQPHLMRAMGIYSINMLSSKRIASFLEAIPDEYRLVDIVLNERNRPPAGHDFKVKEHTNYQLPLMSSFEELEGAFPESTHVKIGEAEAAGLRPVSGLKPELIADFYLKNAHYRSGRDRNFHALQRIMYNVLHRGWGFASGVRDEKDELIAVDFFIYSHGKVMSLVPVSSPAGERLHALTYLYYYLLQTHAGRPLILDFNSDRSADLAQGFGAQPNAYYRIRRDRRKLGVF